jgi:hypothetical protein
MAEVHDETIANGPGAAAVASAAIGCLTLGVLALLGDAFPKVAAHLNLWNPTGALSGVTDAAILVWLATWFLLSRRWARKTVSMGRVNAAAAVMFAAAALLTFPPFMDLLQGK